MDSVTQGLLGAVIAEAGFRHRLGGGAVVAGTLFALLPDADIVARLQGPWNYLAHHRAAAHSLVALLAATPVLGALAWLLSRRKHSVLHWIHLAFWVFITHAMLDWCTSYGISLLWPFTRERYALDAVAIIDPFYTAPLLIAFFLACVSFIPRSFSRVVATAVLVLTTGYLGFGGMQMLRTRQMAADQLRSAGIEISSVRSAPMIGSILVWRVIAREPDGNWLVGLCSTRQSGPIRFFRVRSENDALVRRALESERGALFRWFAMDCVSARVENTGAGRRVILDDMRYGSYKDPTRPVFSAEATFDAAGRLLDVRLRDRRIDVDWREEWDALRKLLRD